MYFGRALFFFFLVDLRSPPQSCVVPTAPLLCSETLGSEVSGCPQQCVHYRDHESCCRGCTPSDGHSWCGQEPSRSYRSYLLYLFLNVPPGKLWKEGLLALQPRAVLNEQRENKEIHSNGKPKIAVLGNAQCNLIMMAFHEIMASSFAPSVSIALFG